MKITLFFFLSFLGNQTGPRKSQRCMKHERTKTYAYTVANTHIKREKRGREREGRERNQPRIQDGISQQQQLHVPSSSWSTLLPVSCSSSEPFDFETKQRLDEDPSPVQKPACPSFQTPVYVRCQS